jgi:hypothetical protein
MNRFQIKARSLLLLLYRYFALVILYGVLAAVVFYVALIGFYIGSSSWAAPVILSRSDSASLSMLAQVLTSRSQLEYFSIDCAKLEKSLEEMKQHRAALVKIDSQIDSAIARENSVAKKTGSELQSLDARKETDNAANEKLGTKSVRDQISQDLAAGLISKGDAEVARLAVAEASNTFTDAAITEVLLRDQITEHNSTATTRLETLSKRAELKSEIRQLDITIDSSDTQLLSEKGQISALKQALAAAEENPIYEVLFKNPKTFLFVPYGTNMQAGSSVYHCALGLLACSKVGHVTRIFPGEVQGVNPLFKDTIRGVMAEVELSDPEVAKAKVLFFGRPLWIF